MMQRAYSVFDNKALIYNIPFFAPTNGAAVRMLADLANDASTSIGRHPADYVLYCIGHYNDGDAAMTPYAPLEHIVDAVALLRIEKQLPLIDDAGKKALKADVVRAVKAPPKAKANGKAVHSHRR